MSINFKIEQDEIKTVFIEEDSEDKCFFLFSDEWENLNKKVLFWNEENKTIINYIGKGKEVECDIPKSIKKIIGVQVYADHHITKKYHKTIIIKKKKEKPSCSVEYDEKDVFENKIIIYDEKEETKSITNIDSELSLESENALQNKVITRELSKRITSSDLDSGIELALMNITDNIMGM